MSDSPQLSRGKGAPRTRPSPFVALPLEMVVGYDSEDNIDLTNDPR